MTKTKLEVAVLLLALAGVAYAALSVWRHGFSARPDRAVEREPQGVAVRAYDRCLPTLVAFKTRSEAEDYRKQHGGRVLTFAEAMKSVQEQ